jgi:AbrB family looped-hinge helix DNA binding protein
MQWKESGSKNDNRRLHARRIAHKPRGSPAALSARNRNLRPHAIGRRNRDISLRGRRNSFRLIRRATAARRHLRRLRAARVGLVRIASGANSRRWRNPAHHRNHHEHRHPATPHTGIIALKNDHPSCKIVPLMKTRMSTRGRIVLPIELRHMLGICAGDSLDVTIEQDRIVLSAPRKRPAKQGLSTVPTRRN